MKFIIQEKVSCYDYRDVIELDSLKLARKYFIILRDKYPTSYYRIVKEV